MVKHTSAVKAAFTFIELLVVIAIIALLAAILFPVFSRSRENARRSSCQSNLKQLGLAMTQYIQDFDERYPAAILLYPLRGANCATWDLLMQPYIKNNQVFVCPSDTRTPEVTFNDGSTIRRSYTMAYYVNNQNNAVVQAPSLTVLLAERTGANISGTKNTLGSYDYFAYTQGSTEYTSETGWNFNDTAAATPVGSTARHLGFDNILYADGHVKAHHFTNDGTTYLLPGHTRIAGFWGVWTNSVNDLPK